MSVIISAITALIAFYLAFKASDVAGIKYQKLVRLLAFFIGGLMALSAIQQAISRFLVIIPSGQVGVVELFGKVAPQPLSPGVNFVNPMGKVIPYSTRLRDIQQEIEATTREGLGLRIDVSLQYKVDPNKVADVYQNLGTNEQDIIIARFRSVVREIVATYDVSAIYGDKRHEVAERIRQELQNSLSPIGFTVEETLLRNLVLPDKIQAAIQRKIEADQQSQQLNFEIATAQKEAQKKQIEAKAIAESQKLLSQNLSDKVLKLKAIEATQKLAESDNTKVIIIGGGSDKMPLILQNP